MKITGGRDYIEFDLENGYVVKASGELLVGKTFVVETSTMKFWEPPHEDEEVTPNQIEMIMSEVSRITNENTARIVFEK